MDPEEESDNARLAYAEAMAMVRQENTLFWQRLLLALLANTALTSVATAMLLEVSKNIAQPSIGDSIRLIWALVASVVGVVLSGGIYVVIFRCRCYHGYYWAKARQCESLLGAPVDLMAQAKEFADGKEIVVKVGHESEKLRVPRWASSSSKKVGSWLMPIFVAVHIVVGLYAGLLLTRL